MREHRTFLTEKGRAFFSQVIATLSGQEEKEDTERKGRYRRCDPALDAFAAYGVSFGNSRRP